MTDKEYAISNLRQLAENIHSYASFADGHVYDLFNEFDGEVEKAEKAVKALADWIEDH